MTSKIYDDILTTICMHDFLAKEKKKASKRKSLSLACYVSLGLSSLNAKFPVLSACYVYVNYVTSDPCDLVTFIIYATFLFSLL